VLLVPAELCNGSINILEATSVACHYAATSGKRTNISAHQGTTQVSERRTPMITVAERYSVRWSQIPKPWTDKNLFRSFCSDHFCRCCSCWKIV